jgi:hypothetical protein
MIIAAATNSAPSEMTAPEIGSPSARISRRVRQSGHSKCLKRS